MTSPRRQDRRTAVYRCYDSDGELLYIGKSVSPQQRIYQHRSKGSPWIYRHASMTEEWFEGPMAAFRASNSEAAAIQYERPAFNLDHNNGWRHELPAAALAGGGWFLAPGPVERQPRGIYPNSAGLNQHVERAKLRCALCGRRGVHAYKRIAPDDLAAGWRCACAPACEKRQELR